MRYSCDPGLYNFFTQYSNIPVFHYSGVLPVPEVKPAESPSFEHFPGFLD
jgi:hypothetical protein